ncbi:MULTISPECIES: ester cyclase [unclassified Meridianimarinicoccus]|uniref:ester cyclase n=1 Tax=unclassified Meridianimarinicoccus TaxID=2923344 RepID=UPI00186881E3|nr:ester cyclase [Fluviibacterium sp. MJW13]
MSAPVARLTRPAAPPPFAWLSAYASRTDVTLADEAFHAHAVIRLPDRVLRGPQAVMADAMALRATLTGCAVLGEEAISVDTRAGPGADTGGMAVATRATLQASHGGAGLWGAATGKPVQMRVLAECWQTEAGIRDAWMIRDTAALLCQIGAGDPRGWLEAQVQAGTVLPAPLTPETDPEPAYGDRGPAGPEADGLAEILDRVLGGEMSCIGDHYAEGCEATYPGGHSAIGRDAVESFWTGLRSAFPAASFRIDHRMGHAPARGAASAAVRWSLYGRHDGFGRFGAPSGAYAYVMGLTQVEFGPNGVRREWTLIDDVAIWTQLLAPRPEAREAG